MAVCCGLLHPGTSAPAARWLRGIALARCNSGHLRRKLPIPRENGFRANDVAADLAFCGRQILALDGRHFEPRHVNGTRAPLGLGPYWALQLNSTLSGRK